MTWRVGRTLGRTMYIQKGKWASKEDEFVGIMDTPELAQQVVSAMNMLQEISKLKQNLEVNREDRDDPSSPAASG